MVSDQVSEVKEMMHNNIELLLERGQKLEVSVSTVESVRGRQRAAAPPDWRLVMTRSSLSRRRGAPSPPTCRTVLAAQELDEKATTLSKMGQQFQRGAMRARRFQMWQQAKFGMAAGTAVTVGVGVVTVPPLVAAMGPGGWAVGGVAAVGAGLAVGVKTGR